jgi:hypothetical protein
MGVDLDDRGLRLVAAVWGSIIMAALADLGMDTEWRGVDMTTPPTGSRRRSSSSQA